MFLTKGIVTPLMMMLAIIILPGDSQAAGTESPMDDVASQIQELPSDQEIRIVINGQKLHTSGDVGGCLTILLDTIREEVLNPNIPAKPIEVTTSPCCSVSIDADWIIRRGVVAAFAVLDFVDCVV